MDNSELHVLREQLERLYQQEVQVPASSTTLWTRLRSVWRGFSHFMVDKSEPVPRRIYEQPGSDQGWGGLFYVFLAPDQEDRDRLGKKYQQFNPPQDDAPGNPSNP